MGFMAENPYVYRHLTGREYLRFCGELLGLERSGVEQRITHVLEEVGMARRADRLMGAYSKGMLQRVSLAQALLGEPELLVLDEPMSGLDPVGRRDVRDIILAQARTGTTIFFSSHIIPDVEALCDRVAIVVDGTVRAVGSVSELVPRETKSFEVTFTDMDLEKISTPLITHHVRSDATWVRVATENRDALIDELSKGGARLASLNPVRINLEDLLMKHYAGGAS
jgi:ABC-2 type transport system ATP-binding protein